MFGLSRNLEAKFEAFSGQGLGLVQPEVSAPYSREVLSWPAASELGLPRGVLVVVPKVPETGGWP
jgi:hypothetical protein